jgi:hypothetical protein
MTGGGEGDDTEEEEEGEEEDYGDDDDEGEGDEGEEEIDYERAEMLELQNKNLEKAAKRKLGEERAPAPGLNLIERTSDETEEEVEG